MLVPATTPFVHRGLIPAVPIGVSLATTTAAHLAPIPVAVVATRLARTPATVRRHRAARIRPVRIRPARVGIPGPVFVLPALRRLRRGRVGRRVVRRRPAIAV